MNRGELTGELFGITKLDVGMPMRSQYTTKKLERSNPSILDDTIDINFARNSEQSAEPVSFRYYDPYASQGGSQFQPVNQSQYSQRQIQPRIRVEHNDRLRDDEKMRHNESCECQIQNIDNVNSEYINSIAFDIYNEFCKATNHDFCVFPIGIMRNLIERDMSLNKILTQLNNSEIFHQSKSSVNSLISRVSSVVALDSQQIKNKIMYYEDHDNMVVELPMQNPNLAFGIICNQNKENINLNSKLFSSYMMNLRKTNINIFIPAFEMPNNLDVTSILQNLGHLRQGHIKYVQTLYFKFQNAVYIKNTIGRPLIDLSDKIVYYVRHVPNNVVLFTGRHL